jgi:hypothetical protein
MAWDRRWMAHKFERSRRRADPGRPRASPKGRNSWSAWLARTTAGATIVSWVLWPTSARKSPTQPSAISSVDTASRPRPLRVIRRHGRNLSNRTWTCTRRELVPARGADLARSDDGLRPVLHRIRQQPRIAGGITRHPESCCLQRVARNAALEDTDYRNGGRSLRHHRYRTFCRDFLEMPAAAGAKCADASEGKLNAPRRSAGCIP